MDLVRTTKLGYACALEKITDSEGLIERMSQYLKPMPKLSGPLVLEKPRAENRYLQDAHSHGFVEQGMRFTLSLSCIVSFVQLVTSHDEP